MKLRTSILLLASALALLASPLKSDAQVYASGVNSTPVTTISGSNPMWYTALDTVQNTGTKNDTLKITETQTAVTFMLVTKKITGTVAGTWVIRGGAAIGEKFATLTTINLTDAEATYSYTIAGNPYLYYELALTGSGTQSASHRRRIVVRN